MGAEEQTYSLDEEEVTIVMEIAAVIERGRKDKLPALRNVPKTKLEETAKVDLSKFKTHNITKTNELFCTEAVVVTNRLGVKIDKVAGRKEPLWKRRLQNKIKELRKDLNLEASKDKDISKVIKLLQEGESYKYLGILEAVKFLEEKMKLNVLEEYIRRLRKVLKSKLNGGNLWRNLWFMELIVSWRISEL